ncbi:thermonuclease family protein [Amaricoccus macauensis]|uniref:thermonuclease family protein n=1 Tax=Amaricoccus macauensis TaxID=57001 RepID=UPI003C7CF914
MQTGSSELILQLILLGFTIIVLILFTYRNTTGNSTRHGERLRPGKVEMELPVEPDVEPIDEPVAVPSEPVCIRGRVWVVDGDTIKMAGHTIRLHGMDAPETNQKGGQRARSHMIRLVGGKDAVAVPIDTDRYGRMVAKVWVGEIDLSAQMTRDGFAVAMSRYCNDYTALEKQARAERKGLWSSDPVNGIRNPAGFRRWKKKRESGDGGSIAPTG